MSNMIFTPPNFLAWSYYKSPQFNSVLQQAASGKTTRAQLWANPIWNYKLTWELMRGADGPIPTAKFLSSNFNKLLDSFCQHAGVFDTFLFDDTSDDSTGGDQIIGYGDGATTVFQASRSLLGSGSGFLESIQNPQFGTETIKVDNVAQSYFNYYLGLENLLLFSQLFTNAAWVSSGPSITPTSNATTAPDGSGTGQKLARAGSSGTYQIGQTINLAANGVRIGEPMSASGYFMQGTSGVKAQIIVNLLAANGAVLQSYSTAITVLTGSWARIAITVPNIPVGTVNVQFVISISNTTSVGDFVYAWGMQLESYFTQTGYLPTTTAIVRPLGQITLASAPAAGVLVTLSCFFYRRVRFKQDMNEFEQFMSNLWTMKTLELVTERA